MKKLSVVALFAVALTLLGCPAKKKFPVAGTADCGCQTADTSDICKSFVDGRCGICADKTCETGGDFCSYMPRDVDFLQKTDGYSTFSSACQNAFDWFSWQSFIAVNWPADKNGTPLKVPITDQPDAPRVWESFLTLPEVFNGVSANKSGFLVLGQNTKSSHHVFSGDNDLEPGSDKPLVDRNLNFTLYEIRVNKEQGDYIQKNGLTTWCGQKTFYEKVSQTVQFPSGSYKSDSVGAVEVKMGWRVLIPGVDDPRRFFTRKAIIVVSADRVVTKVPIRDTVTVGLVAMHLVRNVSNKGGSWIWSSFEQIDNSPECPDGKCEGNNNNYSYYNAKCTGCGLNNPPAADSNNFLWSVASGASKQYGRQYANGVYGSQIGRLNRVEPSTDSISKIWRTKLSKINSVWQYYRLIGSQWLNAEDSRGPDNMLGIPAAQANTAMESYLQVVKPTTGSGSCMSCHGFATGSFQQLHANLSFTLGHAGDSADCNKK